MRRLALQLARVARLAVLAAPLAAREAWRRLLGRPPDHRRLGRDLRAVLETMGFTFVKLGQFLALRFDILPPEVCGELNALFDAVLPAKSARAIEVVERELGGPVDALFRDFEREPFASGSVAQVYRATLHDGEAVAVKVQRPGTAEIFDADLGLIARAAKVLDRVHPIGETPLSALVAEFARFTQREADFLTEARTAERLRELAGPRECFPRVFHRYCTRRVLTMEYVTMPSVAQIVAEKATLSDEAIQRCLARIAHVSMRQLFVDGFFHADPHPGNVLFSEDGTVGMLDFGIFGGLTPNERDAITGFIENLALGNIRASVRHYERMSSPTGRSDRVAFARETREVFGAWYRASADPSTPRERRHIGFYWSEMMAVFRRHHIRMNLDLLLFWRAIFALSATALRLDPSFDLLDHVRRFFRRTRPPIAERVREAVVSAATPRGPWTIGALRTLAVIRSHT